MLADLRLVEIKASELGLELNHSKSELICNQPSIREAMLLEVPSPRTVNCSNATLLGSPIADVDFIVDVIMRKIKMLQLLGERLNLLCSHDALTLLRHSFAIPRVLYTLRTAPCFLSSHLKSFDDILRSTLSSIVNIHLDSESSWLQASLPVKAGGIVIRKATQLATSAFLASAACCSISFVRFFLFTSLKVLILAPRLILLYGERITPTLLHHILLHAAREPGMLPRSKLPLIFCWNRLPMTSQKYVSLLSPAQSLVLG